MACFADSQHQLSVFLLDEGLTLFCFELSLTPDGHSLLCGGKVTKSVSLGLRHISSLRGGKVCRVDQTLIARRHEHFVDVVVHRLFCLGDGRAALVPREQALIARVQSKPLPGI